LLWEVLHNIAAKISDFCKQEVEIDCFEFPDIVRFEIGGSHYIDYELVGCNATVEGYREKFVVLQMVELSDWNENSIVTKIMKELFHMSL